MALISDLEHRTAMCPQCKTVHTLPIALYQSALATRNDGSGRRISVFCPYGHSWYYTPQKELDENERIRLERDRLKQKLAEKDDEIEHQKDLRKHEEHRVIAYRGHLTRTKKRHAAGVCPCCNRTFKQLQAHMATKHPEYTVQEAAHG